jgi:hypothetical protein
MSDEEIGMRLSLDVSKGISGLDDFSNGLGKSRVQQTGWGDNIVSSLDSALSSINGEAASAGDAASSL